MVLCMSRVHYNKQLCLTAYIKPSIAPVPSGKSHQQQQILADMTGILCDVTSTQTHAYAEPPA